MLHNYRECFEIFHTQVYKDTSAPFSDPSLVIRVIFAKLIRSTFLLPLGVISITPWFVSSLPWLLCTDPIHLGM